ncbi:hypothetical protein AGMMS50293_02750 [Spirochaetia bacterium]|nr:hypothetical protein AGMMS50293_02750 [Spirochaetia bacterium]
MANIKDYLEIVIITYNRSSFLDNTLKSLAKSIFSVCNITVLNNASTDDTQKICQNHKGNFENINIITNKFNIGGDANILRSVEVSNGIYTWILADDDEYDFSDCNDVVDMIVNQKADLVHVGANSELPWIFGGSFDTPRRLLYKGYSYFQFSGFISCNIFKTDIFYQYVIPGYKNIINLFPHMPFLISFYENNKNIYISKSKIIKAIPRNIGFSHHDFLEGYSSTACLLKNSKERKYFFYDQNVYNNKLKRAILPLWLLNSFLLNKIKYPLLKFCNIYGLFRLIIALPIFPLYFTLFHIKKNLKSRKSQ